MRRQMVRWQFGHRIVGHYVGGGGLGLATGYTCGGGALRIGIGGSVDTSGGGGLGSALFCSTRGGRGSIPLVAMWRCGVVLAVPVAAIPLHFSRFPPLGCSGLAGVVVDNVGG